MKQKKQITFSPFWLLLMLFSFFHLTANAQDSVKVLINNLMASPCETDSNLEIKFKKLGKEAIPYLINAIDQNKRGFVGFIYPLDSDLRPFVSNYVGIRAAYMIECILSDSDKIKKYESGVIVRTVNSRPKRETLTYEDMQAIKELYLNWWAKNKTLSIKKLKHDWKKGKRVLNNSTYQWY